jgi:hypothetical protein
MSTDTQVDDFTDFTAWEKKRTNVLGDVMERPDEDEGSVPFPTPEVAPRIPVPSPKARAQSLMERVKKAAPAKKPTVRKTHSRVSVEKVIGWGWSMLGSMAGNVNPPVGRVMEMQGPVAGELLEGVVKDTVVDRILQPLARAGERGEMLFALVGPPLLIGALSARPQMAPIIVPPLRESLMMWMRIAGPALEKKRAEAAEFKEEYGQGVDELIGFFLYGLESTPVDDNVSTPSTN